MLIITVLLFSECMSMRHLAADVMTVERVNNVVP